jgi:hypothetical protein
MKRFLAAPLLLLAAPVSAPVSAQAPTLTIEQQTLLRCSAMFALVAGEQAKGDKVALGYPPLAERGREYFVITAAKLSDELGIPREQVFDLVNREVTRVQAERSGAANPAQITDRIMQSCLLSLTASGL